MKLKTSCNVEKTFTLEVFLESRNDEIEIEVTIGFEWQSTGIGAYEYWGRTGYDAGIKYLEPFETIWDSAGFTPEEIKEIEKEIFASYDRWSKEAEEDCANDHFWLIKNPPSGGFHSFQVWAPQIQKLCGEHKRQAVSRPLFALYLRQIEIIFDNLHRSDNLSL